MSKTTTAAATAAAAAAAVDDDFLNPKVSASALDFLLIELVPQVQRTTEKLHAREQALRDAYAQSKILHSSTNTAAGASNGVDAAAERKKSTDATAATTSVKSSERAEEIGVLGSAGAVGTPDDSATREAVFWRLDGLGYRVGQGLVERFSTGKPRPSNALDAIKFVCKDLWQLVFRKQIDNLKTNHRGIFVLTDQRFQPLSRMSVDRLAGPKATEEAIHRAQLYLYFPAGIIRGALAGLGIEATVSADSSELPTATFQIKTKGAKA